MDPLETELCAENVDLFAEEVNGPFDVLRPVRAAAADLVVDDDRTLGRKPFERSEVVMRGPGTTVQGEKWCGSRPEIAGDAVPRAVAAKVDVALGDRRLHAGLQYEVRQASAARNRVACGE